MALLGKGVLAFWHNLADNIDEEFAAWHVSEHIPERLALPGFLRGRRYVSESGAPRYFNFYEGAEVSTFSGTEYLKRLDQPTEWTRKVVASFRDTSRTVCEVVSSRGRGVGGWMETIRFEAEPEGFQTISIKLLELTGNTALNGAHLIRGIAAEPVAPTQELLLRGTPDEHIGGALFLEAADGASLDAIGSIYGHDWLEEVGALGVKRGRYRLQFCYEGHL